MLNGRRIDHDDDDILQHDSKQNKFQESGV